ncbi:MAG TPA: hypothetical protein VLE27_13515 [Thermoanaerobaculia bacterium]|nr:hypothetical protein [Thermoanaerobaculia bacterium]
MSDKADEKASVQPRKVASLDQALSVFAAQKIKKLDRKEVLEALRKEGIGNLEQLVDSTIGSINALDPEDLICFPFYIYRRRNPLFGDRIQVEIEEFTNFAKNQRFVR